MRRVMVVGAALLALCGVTSAGTAASLRSTAVVYDDFSSGSNAKWVTPYGPGETAIGGQNHQETFPNGTERVRAVPFQTGADYSVFDHLKYFEASTASFAVPQSGALQFSADIKADTPGTVNSLTQTGIFGPSGTWTDPLSPPKPPDYSATVLQGQQAGVVLNMVDFCTGQLFDWFVAGNTAFTLIERLPTNVTNNTSNPNCPNATYVGAQLMYTQIAKQVTITPGVVHNVAIRYTRTRTDYFVEYFLDGKRVTKIGNIGIPLDKQRVAYTGTYPSLGPGEVLKDKIKDFSIGHGLFSLLDAFPYQHPDAPSLSVSIPVGTSDPADAGRARLFGQGADGTFDNFVVTTTTD